MFCDTNDSMSASKKCIQIEKISEQKRLSLEKEIEGQSEYLTLSNGKQIRCFSSPSRASLLRNETVVILQGRASFIEKYSEVIVELNQLGFDVISFDWRGQGGSSRLLPHPQKVYIDSFDDYLEDLEIVLNTQHDHFIVVYISNSIKCMLV